MLTKLTIRNFKKFDFVEIELGSRVVFIGPNNSGKTTALQALALWEIGLHRWQEKRGTNIATGKRPGVTLNRRDLLAIPVPSANLFWRDLHVRNIDRSKNKQRTDNIRIEITVEGITNNKTWRCGFEFDYANPESFYCRPLRLDIQLIEELVQDSRDENEKRSWMSVPPEAFDTKIAFLPAMSGLAANETRLDRGAINVRIGEGRTAEILRNLCYQVLESEQGENHWNSICAQILKLFGVKLEKPVYLQERGEITMLYRTQSDVLLDLSSAGRGLQQTLLLLAHLQIHPGSVLLLDEPDAHLEILRQRQIYQLLTELANERNSQIIAASHSEIILNEAAGRDMVIAFIGVPHRIDDRSGQLQKALKEIGFEQYYQAEQTGWVLYLESSTDLAILRALAKTLQHPAETLLDSPFVHYVYNQPTKAHEHFYALREAKPDLTGFALYDRLDKPLPAQGYMVEHTWQRREIENYLCQPDVLLRWADQTGDVLEGTLYASHWRPIMESIIKSLADALARLRKSSPWGEDLKVTDEFLDTLFEDFYHQLGLPNSMRKSNYHLLAQHIRKEEIDPEVTNVLDSIYQVAQKAQPLIL